MKSTSQVKGRMVNFVKFLVRSWRYYYYFYANNSMGGLSMSGMF